MTEPNTLDELRQQIAKIVCLQRNITSKGRTESITELLALFTERSKELLTKLNTEIIEMLETTEYWQGTDDDPDYPEDVFGTVPEEIIDKVRQIIKRNKGEDNV